MELKLVGEGQQFQKKPGHVVKVFLKTKKAHKTTVLKTGEKSLQLSTNVHLLVDVIFIF